ncbi:MAG: hypothetical protein ACRENE_09560 [Polyangiaceae bacterium]
MASPFVVVAAGLAGVAGFVAISAIGCSADPGDALKVEGGASSGGTGSSSGGIADDAAYADSTTSGSSSGIGTSSGSTSGVTSSASSGVGSSSSGSTSGSSSSGSSSSSSSGSSSGPVAVVFTDAGYYAADPGDGGDGGDAGTTTGCVPGSTVFTIVGPNGQSGNFNTSSAVCVQMKSGVSQNWGVSNGDGRMVSVTCSMGTSAPVAATASTPPPGAPQTPQPGPDGYVYWNFTGGGLSYTSMYTY